MEEHLIQLETKIAYLERFIEELNHVVIDHAKEIDQLKKENQNFKQLMEKQDSSEQIVNTKPPHY